MKLDELDYDLPEDLIAQEPLAVRDQARLLVLHRRSGAIEHSRFYKLGDHLREGDLLIVNDTRVLPARLFAKKETGGKVELLFVRPADDVPEAWTAMLRSHRALNDGTRLILDSGDAIRIVGYSRPGRAIVASENGVPLDRLIRERGMLALPHYIRREVHPTDSDDYQTVYAANEGAIAAPTAGLHFTDELFRALADVGIRRASVTLHIGPGTFAPLRTSMVEEHSMESEWYTIPPETLDAIDHTKRTGGRIVAVGTSVARTLESHAITGDHQGFTGLFVHPGFRFKLVEAMITNFHAPRTTVLALVMAFAGSDRILAAYQTALRKKYRFLSYGDAMLVL